MGLIRDTESQLDLMLHGIEHMFEQEPANELEFLRKLEDSINGPSY